MSDKYKRLSTFNIIALLVALSGLLLAFPGAVTATSKASIHGYGELHYNRTKKDGAEADKSLDFHRFVLFFGYQFNEKWSFTSEIELEHNFVQSGQGELELEQAYIQYRGSEHFGFQVGVVLPSVGLINDKHEPPLFMSVERPDYAKNIIPTTWFGNGAAIFGKAGGFDYKLTVMEGLDADGFSLSSGIRGGRMKGFKANADSLLVNFRLDYTGMMGLLAGASISHTNPQREDGTKIGVTLLEAHVKYDADNIYAVFEIGNVGYSDGPLKKSFGYYLDLGYNIGSFLNTKMKIYPWVRYTEYNPSSETRLIDVVEDMYKVKKWLVGVSVKPLPEIIFKAEFGVEKKGIAETETKIFNLGAGYMF